MELIRKSSKQFFFFVITMFVSHAFALAQSDKIEGLWFNDTKEAKIQIYKGNDGKFYGKIVWMKEPSRNGRPKVDEKNPDKEFRKKPILNLVILKGLEKEGDQYTDGSIYDPDNGKTYDCKMTYKGGKTLSIRGYIGISLIGRTTVWERAG